MCIGAVGHRSTSPNEPIDHGGCQYYAGGGYATDESALLVTVVALNNTYGLVVIVLLLGYGLVELPKQMWMVRCVCAVGVWWVWLYHKTKHIPAVDGARTSSTNPNFLPNSNPDPFPSSRQPHQTQNGNLQGKLRRLRGKAAHEFRALSDASMDMSEAVAHMLKTKAEVRFFFLSCVESWDVFVCV